MAPCHEATGVGSTRRGDGGTLGSGLCGNGRRCMAGVGYAAWLGAAGADMVGYATAGECPVVLGVFWIAPYWLVDGGTGFVVVARIDNSQII